MVDFSQLLKRPAGEAKRPPALPPGDYPGVIQRWEVGDQNKNKTPYVRFHLGLTDWPDAVDAQDREGIELGKRPQRRDFYTTEDALWRLDELIRSCGVEPSGRAYEEVLAEMIGQSVTVEVQQYMRQDNSEIGNQVGKVIGQAA